MFEAAYPGYVHADNQIQAGKINSNEGGNITIELDAILIFYR